VHNIFRLRNRASLALYCGGNGFNPYSAGSAATMAIIERNLKRFDPSRPFIPTTSDAGNVHTYPDIDPARFAYLYQHTPFIAEAGIHSIQEAHSLKEIITESEFKDLGKIYDQDFAASHPEIISHFAEYYPYRVPRMVSRASHITDVQSPTLETLSEASQIGAGEFYQLLSDGFQANYPTTTGLMPWVFNRPWPVFSGIMLVDGFNQPTASYYFLKRTYEPVHIALKLPYLLWAPNEQLAIETALIHNSLPVPKNARVSVTIYGDDYQKVWQKEKPVGSVGQQTGVNHDSLGLFTIPQNFENRFFYVVAELKTPDGALLSRSVYWPRCLSALQEKSVQERLRKAPANYDQLMESWIALPRGPWLKLSAAKATTSLNMQVLTKQSADGGRHCLTVRVTNSGTVPSFMTQLDITGAQRVFYATDNFTWLAPGESKDITLWVRWQGPDSAAVLTLSAWNAPTNSIKLK
jgi:beta-mannosidase